MFDLKSNVYSYVKFRICRDKIFEITHIPQNNEEDSLLYFFWSYLFFQASYSKQNIMK